MSNRSISAITVLGYGLLVACLAVLSGCNDHPDNERAEQLVEQASAMYSSAADLTRYQTCVSQEEAANRLLDVLELTVGAEDLKAEEKLTAQIRLINHRAEALFYSQIRRSFDAQCCWAMNVIIQCAEENKEELPEPQQARLQEVKSQYQSVCYKNPNKPYQTAMLTK